MPLIVPWACTSERLARFVSPEPVGAPSVRCTLTQQAAGTRPEPQLPDTTRSTLNKISWACRFPVPSPSVPSLECCMLLAAQRPQHVCLSADPRCCFAVVGNSKTDATGCCAQQPVASVFEFPTTAKQHRGSADRQTCCGRCAASSMQHSREGTDGEGTGNLHAQLILLSVLLVVSGNCGSGRVPAACCVSVHLTLGAPTGSGLTNRASRSLVQAHGTMRGIAGKCQRRITLFA